MANDNHEIEPKHPYVTDDNAKWQLRFSITFGILSLIQLIFGIVLSEQLIKIMVKTSGEADQFQSYFYGDHLWISAVGFVLTALGFSTYWTRSRANGIMLSIMLYLSALGIYPAAGGLAAINVETWRFYDNNNKEDLYKDMHRIEKGRMIGSIFIGIEALFALCWAVYSSIHTCCNPNVRKAHGVQTAGGVITLPQQAPIMIQQPMMTQVSGQQPMMVPVSGQQPMVYAGQQPMMVGGQQPMMVQGGQQPMMVQGGQQPMMVGGQQPMMVGGQQPMMVGQAPPSAPPVYTQAGQHPPGYVAQVAVPATVQYSGEAPPRYSSS